MPLLLLLAALTASCYAQANIDYSQGYYVRIAYSSNEACVAMSKTTSPSSFSATLIGVCMPQASSGGVTYRLTTISGNDATTTVYTDEACTTPASPYGTGSFSAYTVEGSTSVTSVFSLNFQIGAAITGTGIPADTTILATALSGSNRILTISNAATASTPTNPSSTVILTTQVQINSNLCNGVGCATAMSLCSSTSRTFVSALVPDLIDLYSVAYYASYTYLSSTECNAGSSKIGYVSVQSGSSALCTNRGSYYALLSCPAEGVGGAVYTAKASSDSTCSGASIDMPGQQPGVTSYTEAVCYQGSVYVNSASISIPVYTLPLLSTCGSYGRPTPAPTPTAERPPSPPTGGSTPTGTTVVPVAAPTAAPGPDYTQGYYVLVYYQGATANADCVSMKKTANPGFSAQLIGVCLTDKYTTSSGGISYFKTTVSLGSATTTYYTDAACTTAASAYGPASFDASTVSGSMTVTLAYDPGFLTVGAAVSGQGIPASTTITAVNGGPTATITISKAATASTATVQLSTIIQVNDNTCNGVGCPFLMDVCTATNGKPFRSFVSTTVPDLSTYYSTYYASFFYLSSTECNAASSKVGYVGVDSTSTCYQRGSYNALLSCPATGVGGAVETAKASTDMTCTGATIDMPGQAPGVTSYTEPICSQVSVNNAPTPTPVPLFILPVLSTCGSYGRPTPAPTPVAVAPTTRRPTLPPGTPTMKAVTTAGDLSYRLLHVGPACTSTPDGYTVDPFQLNVCAQDTLLGASTYGRYTCKTGAVKITVAKQTFASSDATCQNTYTTTMLSHPKLCDANPYGAGYLQYRCGSLPASLQVRATLLVKSYRVDGITTTPACVSSYVTTKAYILNACAPRAAAGSKKVKYYHKLRYVSTSASTGAISLTETRFAVGDKNCKGSPIATNAIVFAASGCNRDPLDSTLATKQIYYHAGGTASWAPADAFIRTN